jgi:hypothetical protein
LAITKKHLILHSSIFELCSGMGETSFLIVLIVIEKVVGEILKRPTRTDCKSVDLCLHRFESCSPHLSVRCALCEVLVSQHASTQHISTFTRE